MNLKHIRVDYSCLNLQQMRAKRMKSWNFSKRPIWQTLQSFNFNSICTNVEMTYINILQLIELFRGKLCNFHRKKKHFNENFCHEFSILHEEVQIYEQNNNPQFFLLFKLWGRNLRCLRPLREIMNS